MYASLRALLNNPSKLICSPHLHPHDIDVFKKYLEESQCFLEYGSGGSTVYASNVIQVPTIISVETDPLFVDAIKQKIQSSLSQVFLLYCDLGKVGLWGKPRQQPTVAQGKNYISMPWEFAKVQNKVPDLVMIDGRFRVASFLYSLLHARVGTVILVDDYVSRSYYHVVEKFCVLHKQANELAVFVKKEACGDAEEILACIQHHSGDLR